MGDRAGPVMVAAVVCGAGLIGSVAYLVWWLRWRRGVESVSASPFDRRPWRPVGAALCGLISIWMFVGLYALTWDNPIALALYWLLLLLLIVWLCLLAARDLLYTRRKMAELGRTERDLLDESGGSDESGSPDGTGGVV